MRRFSLYKRKSNGMYYAQIKNPDTGTYLPAKSTGTRIESEARHIVEEWLESGIPTEHTKAREPLKEVLVVNTLMESLVRARIGTPEVRKIVAELRRRGFNVAFSEYDDDLATRPLVTLLEEYWNFERSPYVQDVLARGGRMGKRHCYERLSRIKRWRTYFGDNMRVMDLERRRLKDFQLHLRRDGLATKTINSIIDVGKVIFTWLKEEGKIDTNPFEGVRKYSDTGKHRNILSWEEATALFEMPWKDERSRVANLVAMTTGLRLGEILALHRDDIGDDRIFVRHSWSFADGLKRPKGTETDDDDSVREIPLFPDLRDALLRLLASSPYGDGGFIFYGIDPDIPADASSIRNGLYDQMFRYSLTQRPLEVDEPTARRARRAEFDKERVERRIDFHGWRHFFATFVGDRSDARTVQLATRHKTLAMAERYSDHKQKAQFDQVNRVVTEVFGGLFGDDRGDGEAEAS